MNSFILIIFFSTTLMAQNTLLDKETYKSKKNTFENKHAEVNDAYKEYWAAKKNVQLYDTAILNKENEVLSTKVRLENVKRMLETEKKLKRQIKSTDVIAKETIFVKSGNDYITADVNDPEHFSEPEANATKVCLKDQSRCFPFKTENGKRVLSLNRQEVMIELQNLRAAKTKYNDKILTDEEKRDSLIANRPDVEYELARSEKKLDKKKKSLFELFNSKKAGISEEFVDQLLMDTNKENLFGASVIDPANENSKNQLYNALEKNVFGKDTYGLQKEKSDEYQEMDIRYAESFKNVTNLKTSYNLDAPALAVVAPAVYTFPDASLIKRSPSNEESVVLVQTVTTEVVDGKTEVVDGKTEVVDGKTEVVDGKTEVVDGKTEVVDGKTEVVDGKTEVIDGKTEVIDGKNVVIDGKADVVDPNAIVIQKLDDENCTEEDEDCKKQELEKDKEICKDEEDNCVDEVPTIVEKEKIVEETPEQLCAKEAMAKILELFKDDKQDILGKQFSLTAMKTALYLKGKAAPGSVPVSFEQYVNKDQANLVKEEKIQELKKIYTDHGMDNAGAGMDSMIEKMKQQKFNYFSSATRMTNDEASNLYLMLSKSDSPVKFGMEDAAVAWAYGQMNTFQKGTSAYNQLNLSTHVNKMMSATMAGGTNMPVAKLEAATKAAEKVIDDSIATALKTISETCQTMYPDNCVLVATAKQDAFAEMVKTILSKQEPKLGEEQVQEFHLKAQKYLGHPGDADYIEISKGRLMPNVPPFTGDNLKKMQIAAGKTIFSRKPQTFKYVQNSSIRCYSTSYETNGKVDVTESACK